jgi:predicted type IV restriction endonuclease
MIESEIQRIQNDIRSNQFPNEAAVSQGIVLPILQQLGWPVFSTSVVVPEYAVGGRRVDYALCDTRKHPKVFVEVKRIGQTDGADRQLFEYAFHQGVPLAVLTDGQQWSFFLPGEEGKYEERRVYKVDLLERDVQECAERLARYLEYQRVLGGEALEAARSDYRDAARNRQIRETLPHAWRTLVEGQDGGLIELLADKVEDMCGYKPEPGVCSAFLNELLRQEPPKPAITHRRQDPPPAPEPQPTPSPSGTDGPFSVTFQGKTHHLRNASAVMLQVFRLLNEQDPTFLDRFVAQKHGRTRRYVARNRSELYPGRTDLSEQHSVEIVPGWWLGTNYSRGNINDIIRLACEVAQLRVGQDIRISLG